MGLMPLMGYPQLTASLEVGNFLKGNESAVLDQHTRKLLNQVKSGKIGVTIQQKDDTVVVMGKQVWAFKENGDTKCVAGCNETMLQHTSDRGFYYFNTSGGTGPLF